MRRNPVVSFGLFGASPAKRRQHLPLVSVGSR